MEPVLIEGVEVLDAKILSDERGRLFKFIDKQSLGFEGFGEVYLSETLPGVVKAWKYHENTHQNFLVPVGQIKLVLFDDRENSATQGQTMEIKVGLDSSHRVVIPPQIWYGFQTISKESSLIVNCIDQVYDPEQTSSKPLGDKTIPYLF